jgi:diguanylate cyclase (GGDEF)-like protein/PAS domain S-box-containing protein
MSIPAIWWRRLIEPAAEIADTEQRRQAQLVARLLLFTLVAGSLSAVYQLIEVPDFAPAFFAIAGALGVLALGYALACRGRYLPAAAVACTVSTLACYGVLWSNPADTIVYLYLLVPMLLAGVTFSERAGAVWGTAVVGGAALVVTVRAGGAPAPSELSALFALAVLAVLGIVALRHQRAIEADRSVQLARSEARLRAAESVAHLGHWEWDMVHDTLTWSDEIYRIFGLKPRQFGATYEAFLASVHPDDCELLKAEVAAALRGERPYSIDHRVVRPDGSLRVVHEQAEITRDYAGRPTRMLGTVQDITERSHAQDEMRKLSGALQHIADSVVITDRDGVVEYVNPAFEVTTGYASRQVIGQTPRLLKSGRQGVEFYRRMWETILSGQVFSDVFVNQRRDGRLYYEEKTIAPIRDAHGAITHFVATGRDITERMQTQERLQFMAHHDLLTELPNRALFLDRLKQSLARARWHERIVAVLFVDLDHFKGVNDTLGHDIGDRLLRELGARLRHCVRERDTVARFGGDEFVILLDDVAAAADVHGVARKILEALAPPFELGSSALQVTASIGVGMFPADGEDTSSLLRAADAAMYRAKQTGRNNCQFHADAPGAERPGNPG